MADVEEENVASHAQEEEEEEEEESISMPRRWRDEEELDSAFESIIREIKACQ